jgi:hypothetical protein
MVLSELYEICHDFKSYFKTGVNLGWWFLILGVSLSLLPAYKLLDLRDWNWLYAVAAVSYFFLL